MSRPQCQFVVKRKCRQCRMLVAPGMQFCGEHGVFEADQSRRRICCPLDATHSCYEAELEEHLKRCNAAKVMKEIWYERALNCAPGSQSPTFPTNNAKVLKNVQLDVIRHLVTRIDVAYGQIEGEICSDIKSHACMDEVVNSPEYGKTRKHLLQVSSILAHLNQMELLAPHTCFMEFGAGRGKLSHWVAKAVRSLDQCGVAMLERSGARYKFENKGAGQEDSALKRCRVKSDIENVNLKKVSFLREFRKRVFTWKHLCGSGTDAALWSIFNASKEPDGLRVDGYAIVPCCHHLSSWAQYVGKDFLESSGFSPEDFPLMAAITSWATCGFEWTKDDIPAPTDRIDIDSSKKEEIGRKAKRLIDWGRSRFLTQMGFTAELKFYADTDVTPENLLIRGVAKPH